MTTRDDSGSDGSDYFTASQGSSPAGSVQGDGPQPLGATLLGSPSPAVSHHMCADASVDQARLAGNVVLITPGDSLAPAHIEVSEGPTAPPVEDATIIYNQNIGRYLAIVIPGELHPTNEVTPTVYQWLDGAKRWTYENGLAALNLAIEWIPAVVQTTGKGIGSGPVGDKTVAFGAGLGAIKGLYTMGEAAYFYVRRVTPEAVSGEGQTVDRLGMMAVVQGTGGLLSTATGIAGAIGEAPGLDGRTKSTLQAVGIAGAVIGSSLATLGRHGTEIAMVRTWLGYEMTSSPIQESPTISVASAARVMPTSREGGSKPAPHREPGIMPYRAASTNSATNNHHK